MHKLTGVKLQDLGGKRNETTLRFSFRSEARSQSKSRAGKSNNRERAQFPVAPVMQKTQREAPGVLPAGVLRIHAYGR